MASHLHTVEDVNECVLPRFLFLSLQVGEKEEGHRCEQDTQTSHTDTGLLLFAL